MDKRMREEQVKIPSALKFFALSSHCVTLIISENEKFECEIRTPMLFPLCEIIVACET
jgi:hypothetical protein